MKKHLTKVLSFAVTMLMAFTAISFTACSSDDIVTPGPDNEKPTVQTIFSSADDDATRTSIDNKALFYWEKGDKIWIDGGTGFESSSQSNITTAKQAQAKFVVDGSYTGTSYKVLYTGYTNGDTTSTQYSKVTIAHQQTQKAWNDGSHLGTSGDCGTGTAYKQTNAPGYRFTITHRASYLLIYPYLHADLSSYTLEKVEIYSDLSATNIAGTFDFDFTNGLLNADGTTKMPQSGTGKQTMTLTCKNGFQLSNDIPNVTSTTTTFRHLFVVIAPGMHQLTIKYFAKNSSNENVEFIKEIDMKSYEENGVYPFIHVLGNADKIITSSMEFDMETFYQWGATTAGIGTTYGAGPSSTANNSYYTTNYPDLRTLGEAEDDFWADIPNYNESRYYFGTAERQYIYWDNATQWTLRRNGTSEIRRGGLWIRKKIYNLGWINSSGSANRFTPQKGRPATSDMYQYFFLPSFFGVDGTTVYWTRTRVSSGTSPGGPTIYVRGWSISASSVIPEIMEDYWWRVAGRRPATGNADGSSNTQWWQ